MNDKIATCKNCGHDVIILENFVLHLNKNGKDFRGHTVSLNSMECNIQGCSCRDPQIKQSINPREKENTTKCKLDGYIYLDKKDAREHFLNKHPEIVQKWIDGVYEQDRKNVKNINNWAAGEAVLVNSEECEKI
jgi:hypothetical protein